MAIFELGVMKNGLLLVNRTYYNEFGKNKTRNPQIIDAISKMAELVLHNSVKFIKMEKHIVGIYSSDIHPDGKEFPSQFVDSDLNEGEIKNKKKKAKNKNKNNEDTNEILKGNKLKNSIKSKDPIDSKDPKFLQKLNLSSYCIGDENLFQDQIFTLLKKITRVFIKNYSPFRTSNLENTSKYQGFLGEIDKILKDIQYYPIDRLKLAIL